MQRLMVELGEQRSEERPAACWINTLLVGEIAEYNCTLVRIEHWLRENTEEL
jgi:hypothetical protein